MFTSIAPPFQLMRKSKRKREEVVSTSMGNCTAQFPRQTFEKTEVDPKTGALNIKKGEKGSIL